MYGKLEHIGKRKSDTALFIGNLIKTEYTSKLVRLEDHDECNENHKCVFDAQHGASEP